MIAGLVLGDRSAYDPVLTSAGAPSGSRFVGMNGVAVAVPESWAVLSSCEQPWTPFVYLDADANDRCNVSHDRFGVPDASMVRVTRTDSPLGQQVLASDDQKAQTVHGVAVVVSGWGCTRGGDLYCTMDVLVPDRDVVFRFVSYEDAPFVNDLLSTIAYKH
jgi:hypothetical protein